MFHFGILGGITYKLKLLIEGKTLLIFSKQVSRVICQNVLIMIFRTTVSEVDQSWDGLRRLNHHLEAHSEWRAITMWCGVLISKSPNYHVCARIGSRYNAKMPDVCRPPQVEGGGGGVAHAQRPPDSGGRAGHHGRRTSRLQVGGGLDNYNYIEIKIV